MHVSEVSSSSLVPSQGEEALLESAKLCLLCECLCVNERAQDESVRRGWVFFFLFVFLGAANKH